MFSVLHAFIPHPHAFKDSKYKEQGILFTCSGASSRYLIQCPDSQQLVINIIFSTTVAVANLSIMIIITTRVFCYNPQYHKDWPCCIIFTKILLIEKFRMKYSTILLRLKLSSWCNERWKYLGLEIQSYGNNSKKIKPILGLKSIEKTNTV